MLNHEPKTAVEPALVGADLAQRWAKLRLPLLPETQSRLRELKHHAERMRPQQLALLSWHDPLLALLTIRAVNGQRRSGLANEVLSLDNAVMLLGGNRYVELGQHAPVAQLPVALYDRFVQSISRARLAGRLALEWGKLRFDVKVEELQLAATLGSLAPVLMCLDPGAAAMLQHDPGAWDAALRQGEWQQHRFSNNLQALYRHWHLPEALQQLLWQGEVDKPRAQCVRETVRLVRTLDLGWWQPELQQSVLTIAQALRCDEAVVWSHLHRAMVLEARQAPQPCFSLAAVLPMLPGPWPVPAPRRVPAAVPSAAPVAAAPVQAKVATPVQAPPLAAPPAPAGAERKPSNLNEVMQDAFVALNQQVQVTRAMLLLLALPQRLLKIRYAQGVEDHDPLRQAEWALPTSPLLHQLMLKPQAVWYRGEPELMRALPEGLRLAWGKRPCFLMSLFVDGKPVGLMYADTPGAQALQAQQFEQFKQVCVRTVQRIEALAKAK